jgi:DNA-binding GntR family transcriptional regulator
MTERELEKIEKLHEKLEKHYQERDHEKYLKVNQRYHVLLQEITGNQVLNDVVNGLRDKILLYRYRQLYQPDRFQASMNEHRDLMKALRSRDPDAAESIMRKHLMNQCEALRALYGDEDS